MRKKISKIKAKLLAMNESKGNGSTSLSPVANQGKFFVENDDLAATCPVRSPKELQPF